MDEQQIENLADILTKSFIEERGWSDASYAQSMIITVTRPFVVRLFGEADWDLVEEKFREFVMEHDAQEAMNG